MRRFSLLIPPVPDGRPRFARIGKGIRAYMPAKCTQYREKLKLAYQQSHPDASPLQGALSVSISVFIPRPKKHFGTGRNAGIVKAQFEEGHHEQKPDADNFAKMLLDALNGAAYVDDSQVVDLRVRKYWARDIDNKGGLFCEISEMKA
jgi:Holliday junction resolvase RusA-like endonuclease